MDTKKQTLFKRPIPAKTTVSGTNLINFREFAGLFEKWKSDSTSAYSIVYLKEDSLNFNQGVLIKSLLSQVNMPGDLKYALREYNEYVFLDFGFEPILRLL